MNFFERISKVDSRVIFTLLWVIMCIFLIFPMGIPLVPSAHTMRAYTWIRENIREGDIISLSFDYDFGNMPENFTGQLAIMRMAMEVNARVVTTAMWASGGLVAERAIEALAEEWPDKVYGVDFIHLGFKPGAATFISNLMDDVFMASAHVDAFNQPLDQFPIMQDFRRLTDAALVNTGGSGSPGAHQWVEIYAVPSGRPYIGSIESVSIPGHVQNVAAGVMTAMIPGMRGSAEMEQLTGAVSMSSAAMDAQAAVHMLVIILIVLGNLNFFLLRNKVSR